MQLPRPGCAAEWLRVPGKFQVRPVNSQSKEHQEADKCAPDSAMFALVFHASCS